MIDLLNNSFNIFVRIEKRVSDVEVLILEKLWFQFRMKQYTNPGWPELMAKIFQLTKFVKYIDNFRSLLVIDKTSLLDKYDIDFKWTFADKKTLKTD
ncbi:MAG: DUF3738 domain-containing protein [Calditrichaeota bacterium]|nr:MAG: DUF3738 domain-containing protein [Calditrichota bacterium]MBL1203938.1 DUF3738 domain-containing protein [Calditrichota bacterium]NOG43770.1 DUF3738 domain-containing protein [Calditrichota bacterium]